MMTLVTICIAVIMRIVAVMVLLIMMDKRFHILMMMVAYRTVSNDCSHRQQHQYF